MHYVMECCDQVHLNMVYVVVTFIKRVLKEFCVIQRVSIGFDVAKNKAPNGHLQSFRLYETGIRTVKTVVRSAYHEILPRLIQVPHFLRLYKLSNMIRSITVQPQRKLELDHTIVRHIVKLFFGPKVNKILHRTKKS